MSVESRIDPPNPNEQMLSSIQALRDAHQRLEELTGGQVDTVAGLDGRPFLLIGAQERLRQSELAKQTAIINALPAHVALLDSQGRIISVNDAWRKFSGANAVAQSPGLAVGINYLQICDSAPNDGRTEPRQIAAGVRSVLAGQVKRFSIGYSCHSLTEQRWLLLIVTPLSDERPNGAVVMQLDTTESKEAVEEIRHLNETLEQRVLERTAELEWMNDELETFSYSVSHDLRAPLRHISGFVGLLVEDLGPTLSKEHLAHLMTISNATERMQSLIKALLEFSRTVRSDLHKTEIDCNELIQDTVSDFQAETAARGIVWNIHTVPTVSADPALLRMVLVNLISNAVKFTGARAEPLIEIGCASNEGEETILFIRDNGAGFNQKSAGKLFGVFQRLHTEAEFEGTGIGLANVQRIIHRHGGRVWAEGAVDHGATFYVSLKKGEGIKGY